MRQRGQRIPLAIGPIGEGPADPLAGQARRDVRICEDKAVVVVIEQIVPEGLAVDEPDRQQQKPADTPNKAAVGSLLRVGRQDHAKNSPVGRRAGTVRPMPVKPVPGRRWVASAELPRAVRLKAAIKV